jgi:hypothetical protein
MKEQKIIDLVGKMTINELVDKFTKDEILAECEEMKSFGAYREANVLWQVYTSYDSVLMQNAMNKLRNKVV